MKGGKKIRRRRIAPARVKVEGEKGRDALQARLATAAALTPTAGLESSLPCLAPPSQAEEVTTAQSHVFDKRGLIRSLA
jgi:hypothetical protein